jgi:DNA-binding response OmpR family regulator
MPASLLLADAEPGTRGFLERHLPGDGFELVQGERCRPDLVLADDVAAVERWRDQAPVIVLGRAHADAVDCVQAFRRGCDDYLARPFDYQELVERIRAVLRRARPAGEVVEAPPVRIDTRTREVRVAGRRLRLAQKEYELLLRLASEPHRVFRKSDLLRDVWGYAIVTRTRTLDSHASRLRRKLRELDPATSFVENDWGVGYRLLGMSPEQ